MIIDVPLTSYIRSVVLEYNLPALKPQIASKTIKDELEKMSLATTSFRFLMMENMKRDAEWCNEIL